MKRSIIIMGVLTLLSSTVWAQDPLRLVDHNDTEALLSDIVEASKNKRFIFVGELHGEAEAHQLELGLLKGLDSIYGGRLVLGMEMFEADVQPVIDEYYGGIINQRSFESESRIWSNYSDYKPIVEFAKEQAIPLVATNIPRRYANAVYHKGVEILDSLSDYAKQFLPTLPMQVDMDSKSYQSLQEMAAGHGGDNMVNSQAIKDATMAKNILLHANGDKVFYHLNGAYHSNDREGILSFMKDIPAEHILTIATVFEAEYEEQKEEILQKADFILIVKDGE